MYVCVVTFCSSPLLLVSTFIFWDAIYDTGNYMELTRVDDFYIKGFPVR